MMFVIELHAWEGVVVSVRAQGFVIVLGFLTVSLTANTLSSLIENHVERRMDVLGSRMFNDLQVFGGQELVDKVQSALAKSTQE
jgi:hypothetical protein